jgi:hypothetical protein
LLRKRAWLVPALLAKGYQVLGAKAAPEASSGIVTFYHADESVAPALHE